MFRQVVLLCMLLWIVALPVSAQSGPLVAFVNDAGQLIVAGADGAMRWIITNPGENLHPVAGFSWSPNGSRLFFAVQQSDGSVSLRIGEVASQTYQEIGLSSGNLSGGTWLDNATVLYSDNGLLVTAGFEASVFSPFADSSPNLAGPQNAYQDGSLFVWQGGSYVLNGNVLPGYQPNPETRSSGLWSNAAALVAYAAYAEDGNTAVYVANTAGQTLALNSGRSTPMVPEGWIPGTTWLLYRDAAGQVRLTDTGCLLSGCGDNPLEYGVVVLPASASEVQASEGAIFYRDNEMINAVSLDCLQSNTCLDMVFNIGGQAAPDTLLSMGGGVLVYTAYTQNPFDEADREIRLGGTGCLDCGTSTVLTGAVAGLVSPDGRYVVADIIGDGLYAVNLNNLNRVYLSGPGADLLKARWNG